MRLLLLVLAGVLALSPASWFDGSVPVRAATAAAAPDPLQRAFDLYAGKGRSAPSLKAWRELSRLQASTSVAR